MNPCFEKVCLIPAAAPEIRIEHRDYSYVNDLAFTSDGRRLASGSTGPRVRVWDVVQRVPQAVFDGQTDKISAVAISPTDQLLASGSDDSTVMVWDMDSQTRRYVQRGHTGWVNAVKFSIDGKLLASGSMDGTVRLANAVDGKQLSVFEFDCPVNSLAFSPNGDIIAVGGVDTILYLADVTNKRPREALEGHTGPINSVAFSKHGSYIASCGDDMTVKLWELGEVNMFQGHHLRDVKTFYGHSKRVCAVAFSPNAALLASGYEIGGGNHI